MLGQDCFDLLSDLNALTLQPAAPRQTGLVEASQMGWNTTECKVGLEFKSIYISRMEQFAGRFTVPGVVPIAQVSEDYGKYCISGTIKRLQTRRVRAFETEFPEKYGSNCIIYDENDELEIEDKTSKLKLNVVECLVGGHKLKATDFPQGVHVVLEGRFKKHSNRFSVRHLFLPTLAPQLLLRHNTITQQGVPLRGKQMLVLSEPSIQQCMAVAQKLRMTFSEQVRSIAAVVVIGGVEMQVQSIRRMAEVVQDMKDIVDVFMMPSSNADRRRMFPLQPYNGNFFARTQTQIGLCSNPQQFTAENGLKMHVSCGENVLDFLRNCSLAKDQLEVLEQMVNFSHYCPTSPFSLRTEPYLYDHLVMHEMPHVMVSGKAKKFGSRMLKIQGHEVLLVAVPAGGMALVNLQGQHARSFN